MTTELPPPAPVFPMLVGCWRSGTTLLRSVFDSHPDLAVPDETNLLPAVLDRLEGRPFDLDGYLDAMYGTPRYRYWGVPDEVFGAALDLDPPTTLADAVRLTYRAYAWHAGKRGYADKTPGHLVHIDRIGALLPEARFVHLVRDGRDVALALRDADFGPKSIDEAALHWRHRVSTGRSLGAGLGDRYREVRYEDLVADPASTLREVCDFLSIRFDEAMLDHERSARALVGSTLNPGVHDKLAKPIHTGARDWRTQMTTAETARFELVAGSLLDDLGYERGVVKPSVGQRVGGGVRRMGLELLKTYRRVRQLNSAGWW